MKRGEDQYPGILGIGMVAKNPHSSPAELAAVRPDAPAGEAGLRKGDRIVEVDGQPINTQTNLRFALGPRYGGESVRVVALRGDERIERTIKLASKLPAFRHAFLGILPMRKTGTAATEIEAAAGDEGDTKAKLEDAGGDKTEADAADESGSDDKGIVVRMVVPGSPAAAAGIVAGDRVVRINDTETASVAEAFEELNNLAPGGEVSVKLVRGAETLDLKLTAARLPTSALDALPPAYESTLPAVTEDQEAAAVVAGPQVKTSDLKLAEFKQQCQIYVPQSADDGRRMGMLLWLHAPGNADAEQVIRDWQAICDRDGLVLVVPTAAEGGQWERTDLEYLRKLTLQVLRQQKIDPHRVVVLGQGGGGTMAWLLGLSGRSVFRGVAVSAAPLPRQVKVPENEPSLRLAVFAGLPSNEDDTLPIVRSLEELSAAGYPVTTVTLGDRDGLLSASEREELARWIDALDRF
jgi:poly(3-hydroxybutyrate) depolymerase